MLESIEKLLTLQDRDQRLRAFQTELANIPLERQAKEKQIADSAARLELSKTRAKAIEVEKRTLEGEAQAKRDAITKYKQHQLQTRKNEEFTALNHEIAAAEKVIVGIEDKELELMDEAEQLQPAIAAAEKIHAEEKAKIDLVLHTLEGKKDNIESRIVALKQEREAATVGIDEDDLDRYQRLFKNKSGTAVVALDHEVCTGCHMKVTTQTAVEVRAEKDIVHCPQCGRMLYLPN
jgi:predicted  nucleic acid-binding Zn-ribbon protein